MTASSPTTVLVSGAGGFIGGHLVRRLLEQGASVRAVDQKPIAEWHQSFPDDSEQIVGDLRLLGDCERALAGGFDEVYNLAADMGGMGFIETNKAACMLSVLISTHMLMAARQVGVGRFFYSSSACVYAEDKQDTPEVAPLAEDDAYPAMAEDGYGWEKLFSERMCRHYLEDYGVETRVARYHNVYGPYGAFDGGREKAPAAICRKVSEAVRSGKHSIEIWGDGKQTRSFMYVDDCLDGTLMIARGPRVEPINLGSSELVRIDGLVSIVESIAGVELARNYDTEAPQGVRGRNSDNTMIAARYGWEPSTPLASGLRRTYQWIDAELAAR